MNQTARPPLWPLLEPGGFAVFPYARPSECDVSFSFDIPADVHLRYPWLMGLVSTPVANGHGAPVDHRLPSAPPAARTELRRRVTMAFHILIHLRAVNLSQFGLGALCASRRTWPADCSDPLPRDGGALAGLVDGGTARDDGGGGDRLRSRSSCTAAGIQARAAVYLRLLLIRIACIPSRSRMGLVFVAASQRIDLSASLFFQATHVAGLVAAAGLWPRHLMCFMVELDLRYPVRLAYIDGSR
ncbi:hypothetical protein BJ912DRAFT_1059897 [Pholiota molesta]|nr:hypothetical protein BJ912DRAFT_1059897 [Pholiota molesta]